MNETSHPCSIDRTLSTPNVAELGRSGAEPLLVRAPEASRLCGVSEATWHRLRAADRTPAPLRLGSSVLWRVSDLKLFVEWGCPSRKEFEARLQAERGRH
jgi:predicted DNA-binding transcriptional regulator AlpA